MTPTTKTEAADRLVIIYNLMLDLPKLSMRRIGLRVEAARLCNKWGFNGYIGL